MLIPIWTTKGGTGKTTICTSLAWACKEIGLDPLVLDLDPQTSATFALGSNPLRGNADAWIKGYAPSMVTLESGIKLIPGHIDVSMANDRKKISAAFAPIKKHRGPVIIDLPTGWTTLAQAILTESSHYIGVAVPEVLCVHATAGGLKQLQATRPDIKAIGAVVNLTNPRTSSHADLVDRLQNAFGPATPLHKIRRSVTISDAAYVAHAPPWAQGRSPALDDLHTAALALANSL